MPHLAPTPLRDILHSYQWGWRDALRPRLALTSVVVACLATVVMLIVFIVWHGPITQELASLAQAGLSHLMAEPKAWAVGALTWLMTLLTFGLGVFLLVQLALQFWLMPRIQKYCLLRHAALKDHRADTSLRHGVLDGVRTALTWVIGGLVCLLIPVVGSVLMLALSSYLTVRSLVNDALDGLATDEEVRALIRESRLPMLGLGILVALIALIPLVGLLVPVLAGTSTCHLMMTRLARLRATAVRSDESAEGPTP
jgi:hypothetical protein